MREVGKVFGLTEDIVGALSGSVWGSTNRPLTDKHLREAGLDPQERIIATAVKIARELIGFPRHLSQHVGGFIISRGRLDELIPIQNATMADRTVVEWDKNDLEALGILKIDILALGMLSCIRKALQYLNTYYQTNYNVATISTEDPVVYDMNGILDASSGICSRSTSFASAFILRLTVAP